MKIEEVKSFKVGSYSFKTKEEAEAYVESKTVQKSIYQQNRDMLNKHGGEYIPVIMRGNRFLDLHNELEIFTKSIGSWGEWVGIFRNEGLDYYNDETFILTDLGALVHWMYEHTPIIHYSNLHALLRAIESLASKDPNADYKAIVQALAEIQVRSGEY